MGIGIRNEICQVLSFSVTDSWFIAGYFNTSTKWSSSISPCPGPYILFRKRSCSLHSRMLSRSQNNTSIWWSYPWGEPKSWVAFTTILQLIKELQGSGLLPNIWWRGPKLREMLRIVPGTQIQGNDGKLQRNNNNFAFTRRGKPKTQLILIWENPSDRNYVHPCQLVRIGNYKPRCITELMLGRWWSLPELGWADFLCRYSTGMKKSTCSVVDRIFLWYGDF